MRLVVVLCIAISTSVAPAVAQTSPPPDNNKAPEHMRTGWATLMKDSAQDFVAFPRRTSTWVILAIGAVAALATHPADDHVERHIVGNDAADTFFSVGRWAGSTYVQMGSAVGLWAVGRYVAAPVQGEPRTNKYSEIGFDLIRTQILSQAITQGMSIHCGASVPRASVARFPRGTRRPRSPRLRSSNGIWDTAPPGRRWLERVMWRRRASWTIDTSSAM